MAARLPTLCTAPCSFFLSSNRSKQTKNLSLATARRHNLAQPVKAATRVEDEVPRGCGTNLSAWTSIRQERWEGDLAVEGHLPLWLNGTYLRNGAGVWEVGDSAFDHVFDGYAMLVRISFRQGRATGAHRQVESEAYMSAKANGRPVLREFSQCPGKPANLIDRVRNVIGLITGALITDNANVTVTQLGDGRVVCLSESTKSTILVDPNNLGTMGRFSYTDGLSSMLQSGHPVVNESEFLTLLPDLVRSGYLVVRMEAGSSERKVIGRVDCRGGPMPGWMHSFAVTEKYVVVPEMPLRYSASSMLKCTGKKVASVEVPPFMTFHFINAYEEKAGEDGEATAVILDCCEYYADPTMIQTLLLHKLRSGTDKDELPGSRVGRFRIPLDGTPFGELQSVLDPKEHGRGIDMCNINPSCLGKKYRYIYACGAHRPCSYLNTLTKIDLLETTAKTWYEEGAVPSEPYLRGQARKRPN
ncbi:hypothetical protein PR202_gb04784 [Eleusine coracana subsp. coracana]|uniref:Uncharacterized protein n=1 Tax=Eleusine coracana subsp. coracana TaxID=191504 RepID=A0AAV5E3S0_ELECO|nr:hypothetical protein PR202_gb04784 [Eleusine coracana subsp. coracana]